MNKINNLVSSGKKLDLRVNFTNKEMDEKQLVENFYEKLTPENRQKVLLKYSMTTRVFGESQENFFTPDLLKAASPTILRFVDEFKEKFPTAPMYAERPLFPCSFDEKTWDTYAQKGGFTSTCDMEFTVYPNTGLALCPPSRALEPGLSIQTPAQLRSRISELRRKMETIYRIPSFSNCDDCEKRIDLSCQGGCLGYKVGLEHNLG